MLTEEQLEIFGDRMAGLYQAFEQDIIADIARRVKKTGRYTETAELMAQAMYHAGASPAKIRAEVMKALRANKAYQDTVAQNTLEWKKYVKSEIKAMKETAAKEGNTIIAEAGDMSFNYDLSMWEQAGKKLAKDSSIAKMVEEMSIATAGTFENLTKTMGFKGPHDFTSIQELYIRSLDKAVLKMATGTFSFDQCVNDAVREMSQSGLRSVDYASGRTYQLDTAARMCIRTSCHKLAGSISMRNCETTGTDLVEVSAHWGAREEHAAWQGKIYSRSGKNKKYPPFSICQYGAVDGLMGVNCRHTFYPFFEGISTPNKWKPEPNPKEYKGKIYTYTEATQKQRKMERDIRATKRELEAQKAIGGDTKLLEARKRKQIADYHNFSKEMDISPKDNRLRVIAGSSDVSRTKVVRRTVKSGAKSFNAKKTVYFDSKKSYRIDMDGYSKAVCDGLSMAAREVAQAGSQNMWEYCKLVNLKTGENVFSHTDKEFSSVGGFYKYLMAHENEEFAFIHNHNTDTILSVPDLQILASEKNVNLVAAVRNDGIISVVESNGKKTTDYLPLYYEAEIKEFEKQAANKKSKYYIDIRKELFTSKLAAGEFGKGLKIIGNGKV